jgi:alkylation response protein AidB-like acyl-CoA dehydrogenase
MDFAWSDEDELFRSELRDFVEAHSPGKPPRGATARLAWQKSWHAALVDGGYAGPSWPKAFGGMDLPFSRQVVYQQEIARARVPAHPGTGVQIAAPAIIKYGTDEQRRRFLRPMLRADVVWAQGFSEPEAGSDLPALRTTAVRDGDRYIVRGQKVWSSSADIADMLFTLVRTGAPDSRQEGISYLMIDLHSPGVTVRPLRDLTGGSGFTEIFLDQVDVPVDNRIGEENEGWTVTRTSLGHERAAGALNQAAMYRRIVSELQALAKTRGVSSDGVVRQRLAAIECKVRIMTLNAMRTISDIVRLGEPGPASSVSRLFNSTFEQELHVLAVDILGVSGTLGRSDPDAVEHGRWTWGFLRTRASTIGAGTAEIQRNTIAERLLGLPPDPAPASR